MMADNQQSLTQVFDGNEIRIVEFNADMWMPCKDLSLALGLDRTTLFQHVKRNRDFFGDSAIDGDKLSQDGDDIWVNEMGLYTLLARVSVGRVTPQARSSILQFRKSVPHLIQQYRKHELIQDGPDTLLQALNRNAEIARALVTGYDYSREVAVALAMKITVEECPAAIPWRGPALPAPDHEQPVLPGADPDYETHYTAKKVGEFAGLGTNAAEKVNRILETGGFQYQNPDHEWRLTKKGENIGKIFRTCPEWPHRLYERTHIRWNPDAVKYVKAILGDI